MTRTLREEIKQTRPFVSLEEEAALSIQRAAAVITQEAAELFRPHGISAAQYNVLRILRGAGPGGRTCGEIAERMIARDPDVTRLLDRLEKAGLAVRERSAGDRRVVITRISDAGLRLTGELDVPVAEANRRRMATLSQGELAQLSRLLARIWSEGGG